MKKLFFRLTSLLILFLLTSCSAFTSNASVDDLEYQRSYNDRVSRTELDSSTTNEEKQVLDTVGFFGRVAEFFK